MNPIAKAIQDITTAIKGLAEASRKNTEAILALEKRLRKLENAQNKSKRGE